LSLIAGVQYLPNGCSGHPLGCSEDVKSICHSSQSNLTTPSRPRGWYRNCCKHRH
jgi:hypothetical protein